MIISAHHVDTMCDNDATMTKRWAPFSPPDNFDVADATCPVSWVLATRGDRGGAPGGCPKRVGSFRYSTDFLMRKSTDGDTDSIRKL